ncbi:MAG: hypothetical protein GEV08_24730, partial [Acidimicrobiia bacterium]|nr:hypothetical protein [Acidimicrobiia bacterium]
MKSVSTHRAGAQHQAGSSQQLRARHVRQLSQPAPATVRPIASYDAPRPGPRIPARVVKTTLVLADLITIVVALALAFFLAARTGGRPSPDQYDRTWLLILLALPVWLAALVKYRTYQSRFVERRTQEFRRVAGAAFVGAASLLLIPNVWRFISVQRDFVFYSFLFGVGLLMVERELVRHAFAGARRKGKRLRPLLIVGDNTEG